MIPTLAAAYTDLAGDVGFYLGFGRGEANGEEEWDEDQLRSINRCVKGGLRNFYHCGYDWSFLKPVYSATLAEGEQRLHLPDDFGGVEGKVTVSVAGSSMYQPVFIVGDVRPRYARQPDMTGYPEACCIDPLKGVDTTIQKFDLFVFPEADQDYTMEFAYYLNPSFISGELPYAYGGPQHAETLLESCLAVAETTLDDKAEVHQMLFQQRLQVSKDMDRRNKPQHLGYNRDRSDGKHRWRSNHWDQTLVTFDGVEPG